MQYDDCEGVVLICFTFSRSVTYTSKFVILFNKVI